MTSGAPEPGRRFRRTLAWTVAGVVLLILFVVSVIVSTRGFPRAGALAAPVSAVALTDAPVRGTATP